MHMKLSVFIFLCFSFYYCSVQLVQAQDNNTWLALADSTVRIQTSERALKNIDETTLESPISKDFLHFQLDTTPSGSALLLLHLKDSVNLLTISAHDMMGISVELIRENQLNQGFYEFALPKSPSESLKYWQVSMDGQKVVSFIK